MDKEKILKAIEYAKQNPNSPFANELRKRIESGQVNLKDYGIGLQPDYQKITANKIQEDFQQKKTGGRVGVAEAGKNILKGFEDKFMKPASNLMFGSLGKVAGSLVQENVSAGAGVLGSITGNEKLKQFSQETKGAMDDVGTADTVFAVIEAYPGGGFLTKSLKGLPGGSAVAEALAKIPEGMRAAAVKQYSVALGATQDKFKKQTAKVVPELLKKGVHGSLEKIKSIAGDMGEVAGKAVGKAKEMLSGEPTRETRPFIKTLQSMRNRYMDGDKVLNPDAIKAIDEAVDIVGQYGKEISDKSLQKIKEVLDEAVEIANKSFTKTEGLSAAAKAKEKLSNSIRNFLAENNKELGAANKEFSLWKKVDEIITATLNRKSTQTGGLTKLIVPSIGAGSGFASGDGLSDRLQKAIVGVVGTKMALRAIQSPQYKTWMAVNKNKIAEYLSKGDEKNLLLLVNKFIAGIKNKLDD